MAEDNEIESEEIEISDKHQSFVDEYAISLNATDAYQKVYKCSYEVANSAGPPLTKRPEIQAAIIKAMEAGAKRCEIKLDFFLINLREGVERCMQHTPVLDKDGKETGEYTFQAGPMFKGLDLVGKYLGVLKERHELSGNDGGPITHRHSTYTIVDPKKNEPDNDK